LTSSNTVPDGRSVLVSFLSVSASSPEEFSGLVFKVPSSPPRQLPSAFHDHAILLEEEEAEEEAAGEEKAADLGSRSIASLPTLQLPYPGLSPRYST
jgi:hypothetical protein